MNEVKRQAMSELQKAVSDAERKAHEMISAERSKMERALAEAKRQASEDALTVINQQEDSSEVSITKVPPIPGFLTSFSKYLTHLALSPLLCFPIPFTVKVLMIFYHSAQLAQCGAALYCHIIKAIQPL